MSEHVSRYTVTICGDSYTVVTNESKDHIDYSINMIEDIASDIRKKSSHMSDTRVITLVALQLADKLIKFERSVQQKEHALLQVLDTELVSDL